MRQPAPRVLVTGFLVAVALFLAGSWTLVVHRERAQLCSGIPSPTLTETCRSRGLDALLED